MTNRVVLGRLPDTSMGLRVSRPGSNVMDDGLAPKNVAFDSRWPRAFRLHMSGAASDPSPGNATTVSFGRSFAAPPFVMIVRTIAGQYRFDATAEVLRVFVDRFEYRLAAGGTFSYYVVAP